MEKEQKLIAFYDNQRYYPVITWSANLLPSDSPACTDDEAFLGQKVALAGAKRKEDLNDLLPQGWVWLGRWRLEVEREGKEREAPYSEGWQYAFDFSASSLADMARDKQTTHLIRRRKWLRKAGYCKRPHFGVPLDAVPTRMIDGYQDQIPTVLLTMKSHLVQSGGLSTRRIFNMQCDSNQQEDAKHDLNCGQFNGVRDLHVIATLIKEWFRELPTSLLASIDISKVDVERGVERAVKGLPEPNQSIYLWLLDLCRLVLQHRAHNESHPDALALAIAPNLFPPVALPGKDEDPTSALQIANRQARFFTQSLAMRSAQCPTIPADRT